MKRLVYILVATMMLTSCGGTKEDKGAAELEKLKKERAELDQKISKLEASKKDTSGVKITPVSVTNLEPAEFNAYVEVQSQITSDENVNVLPQAAATVQSISVHPGQKVSKGQVMAYLDASVVAQNIETLTPQLNLQKALLEKQENLWKQNIGTEVQLMQTRAQYEATQKQIAALKSQWNLYRIVSPISGTVDAVNLKVGDVASPMGAANGQGIRVVSYDKLKAEASLGENYLGKVKQGDKVLLVLPDVNDTIRTTLTYVAQAVDPQSRAFTVQVRLPSNKKLHPNMACNMKIVNYQSPRALVVPVSVIQKTSGGDMLYVVDGNKAKSVMVKTGRNANGQVEILEGLKQGDKVITKGFEELDNGQQVTIQ